MSNYSYVEHTSFQEYMPGGQPADLCVRARIIGENVCVDLVAAPTASADPSYYVLGRVPESKGHERIGVNLGSSPEDTTPHIIYEAASALYGHFGGAIALGQTVERQPEQEGGRFYRPIRVTARNVCEELTVPRIDGYDDDAPHNVDSTLTFYGVDSSEVGRKGLIAMIALQRSFSDEFAVIGDFSLSVPNFKITE